MSFLQKICVLCGKEVSSPLLNFLFNLSLGAYFHSISVFPPFHPELGRSLSFPTKSLGREKFGFYFSGLFFSLGPSF